MLESLRKWGQKMFPPKSESPVQQSRLSGDEQRERRAQSVSTLQGEIHRIQHEISDLNETMTGEAALVTDAQQLKMAALHRELANTQRELGKYQARI